MKRNLENGSSGPTSLFLWGKDPVLWQLADREVAVSFNLSLTHKCMFSESERPSFGVSWSFHRVGMRVGYATHLSKFSKRGLSTAPWRPRGLPLGRGSRRLHTGRGLLGGVGGRHGSPWACRPHGDGCPLRASRSSRPVLLPHGQRFPVLKRVQQGGHRKAGAWRVPGTGGLGDVAAACSLSPGHSVRPRCRFSQGVGPRGRRVCTGLFSWKVV